MRIAGFEVIQKPGHYTITIRKIIDFMKEYQVFSAASLQKILEYLKQENKLVSSAPMVCFHNQDLNALDVEIGFEIAENIDDCDEIHISKVRQQKAAVTIDQGEYIKQDPTLMELIQWIDGQGYTGTGPIYYYYLNDPNRPEEELLTQMVIPVRGKLDKTL